MSRNDRDATILGIDPGSEKSGFAIFCPSRGWVDNAGTISNLELMESYAPYWNQVVIEEFQSYGVKVGRDVFTACHWGGRFCQAFAIDYSASNVQMWSRQKVLNNFGASKRGLSTTDTQVRASLIRKFGGKASTKKHGRLEGVTCHAWQALGVAVSWYETVHKVQFQI
jgi:hypothetical protein